MANSIDAMIAAYRVGKLDPQGESHVKCDIVESLEGHLAQPKVLAFFLDLISDPDEYDLARVDALKILQLYEPHSGQVRTRIGRRLAEVMPTEPDLLVQQWMAIAAENFLGVPEVFAAVASLLVDAEIDLGVRHNCLAPLRRLGTSPEVRGLLEGLVADPQLGDSVRFILRGAGIETPDFSVGSRVAAPPQARRAADVSPLFRPGMGTTSACERHKLHAASRSPFEPGTAD